MIAIVYVFLSVYVQKNIDVDRSCHRQNMRVAEISTDPFLNCVCVVLYCTDGAALNMGACQTNVKIKFFDGKISISFGIVNTFY